MLMNARHFLSATIAALMANPLPNFVLLPDRTGPGRKTTRISTGAKYPHSSARQRARYARQLAAGQIKFRV